MYPSPERPALGRFVYDQVQALRRLPELEIEVFSFPPGGYIRAWRELRARAPARFDLVHASFWFSSFDFDLPRRCRQIGDDNSNVVQLSDHLVLIIAPAALQ